MKKVLLSILFLACFITIIGCANSKQSQMKEEEKAYADSLRRPAEAESLLAWTPDTILKTNPELVMLFDTLYQYAGNNSVPTSTVWLQRYREKLCTYYDKHHLGSDTISFYAKADTVINAIERLYDLNDDWNTMGMVVNNSAMFTLYKYREFNTLSQIEDYCTDSFKSELLNQEIALFDELRKKMDKVAVNIVYLNYWDGSIVGPLATSMSNSIINARIDMCKTILSILNLEGWAGKGVYPDIAKRMLMDSCAKAIDVAVKGYKEALEEIGKKVEPEFNETEKKAKAALKDISPLLDEWLIVWDKLDEALTHDSSRHTMERAAAHMLYEWASLVALI